MFQIKKTPEGLLALNPYTAMNLSFQGYTGQGDVYFAPEVEELNLTPFLKESLFSPQVGWVKTLENVEYFRGNFIPTGNWTYDRTSGLWTGKGDEEFYQSLIASFSTAREFVKHPVP